MARAIRVCDTSLKLNFAASWSSVGWVLHLFIQALRAYGEVFAEFPEVALERSITDPQEVRGSAKTSYVMDFSRVS
jgi:hypothetical protein